MKHHASLVLCVYLATALFLGVAPARMRVSLAHDAVGAVGDPPATPPPAHGEAAHAGPVMFIENDGQFAEGARFQVWGGDRSIWLAEDAIWLTVVEPADVNGRPFEPPFGAQHADSLRQAVAIRLSFVNANPHPALEPFDRLDTVVSYFLGNDPAGWRPDVPVWGGVRYVNLYPGIDLEVVGASGQIVQRLVARAGADLSVARLRVEGADTVTVEADALRLGTASGEAIWPLLRAERSRVGATVQVLGKGTFAVSSPFAAHRTRQSAVTTGSQSLYDDPADLLYGTFIGGSGYENASGVRLDGSGSAYIAGNTDSSDFPTTPGVLEKTLADLDAYVLKLNTNASVLVYATFLGGSENDYGAGVAVDTSGAAYLTGSAWSRNFPTTPGAFDTSHNGYSDAYVAKLNPAGSALAYATFLGGSSNYFDFAYGFAVDGSGAAYVLGHTGSHDFPTTPGAFDPTFNGGADAFVTKLNPAGSALVYGTFLGSSGSEGTVGAIAVDADGAAYVTGQTKSSGFPTTPNAFDRSYSGGTAYDAFVVKLSVDGSSLVYSTFLGGAGQEDSNAIAVDATGAAYVTGMTESSDFPTTPSAFDRTYNGDGEYPGDVFVAKLNAAGSILQYSTLVGGGDADSGQGIALDESGVGYVIGYTYSSDFPTRPGAFDSAHNAVDAFVARLNAAGSILEYSTFVGGSGSDSARAIVLDGGGVGYIAGNTGSGDFPTTAGAYDRAHNGGSDIYLVKLLMEPMTYDYSVYLPIVLRNH